MMRAAGMPRRAASASTACVACRLPNGPPNTRAGPSILNCGVSAMTDPNETRRGAGLRGAAYSHGIALRRERHDRAFIPTGTHVGTGEDLVARDPLERLLEPLLCVGLEHEPLARAPAAGVHHGVPARRELLLVVVRVALRPQVDVTLGALERAEEFSQILRVGIAGHDRPDHEGGVDHLAEAELLGEVVGAAEQVHGRRLAVDQKLHAL